jgi:DNA-binding transcriptional regulator YdaS (Cro superfamily)
MNLSECLLKHKISQTAIAEFLGVTQSAVSQWMARGIVPAEHCTKIEKYFAGAIRCEDLNSRVDWAYLRAASEVISTNPSDPVPEVQE